jgi:phosphatidylserine/phosphatidylglycerophosphate/cardiolipin synthase-like enzyme
MKHSRSQFTITLLTIIILLNACVPASVKVPTPTQPPAVTPLSPPSTGNWLEIYFTNPTSKEAKEYQGGPDKVLADSIDAALLSVDVAAYSFNLWSIRNALFRAHQRGVVVRMVMESDNMDSEEVQELLDAGIHIVGDQREGLMHDKFVVIDRTEVWTGSMNFTLSGAYEDNNNLIRMHSGQIAANYTREFDEMFVDDRFGQMSRDNTPYPQIKINNATVEFYYSPDEAVAARIITLLQGAQQSIHFMAASFTSEEIGNVIIEAADNGILVSGVMDSGQVNSNEGTRYDFFKQSMLDVRLDGIDGQMHHKVIIIDEKIVITGSYNFTNSAEDHNDENVVIIFDEDAAAQYMLEFLRVYGMAQP